MRQVLEDYQRVLAFIIQGAKEWSVGRYQFVSIYGLLEDQRKHDPVNVRRVMDMGWKGYLANSVKKLLEDQTAVEYSLDRMFRFAYALNNTSPRDRKETQHPNYPKWEAQDRAVLCQSIEVSGSEHGLIWIMATESIGGRGEEPGPRYLSWYNDMDTSGAFTEPQDNEDTLGDGADYASRSTVQKHPKLEVHAFNFLTL